MTMIGWLGSTLLAICGLPEVIRTIKHKKCFLGWGFLTLWGLGEILTFAYVFRYLDFALLTNYGLNIIMISIMIFYKVRNND